MAQKEKLLTLAIETSCDETSAAVTENGRDVLSNIISSQIEIHKDYGGVVPEIASRHHLRDINRVVDKALEEAGKTMDDMDMIGVTYGPGLVGALLIGLATAKAYALAKDIPLVGVNHMHGHICANYIEHRDLAPPFTAIIVSGGHTDLAEVTGYNSCRILGCTRDDAIGEAYDKVARILGLGYPGGPAIDELAKKADPERIKFKRVFLEKGSKDFSFSGIKTAVLNYMNTERQVGREPDVAHVAAGFQEAVLDVIVTKSVETALERKDKKLVMAGGVAANSRLREMLEKKCEDEGIKLYYPSPVLCTDNGAMIGCAAYYKYITEGPDGLDLDGVSGLSL